MKRIKIEHVILALAASFASYNFGLAGGFIEGTRFSVGGLIAGVVVNVSLAIAASRFGSLNGKKRTRQATAAFLAMLVLSPLVVAPVVFVKLPSDFVGGWLGRAVWSSAWTLVADFAIVLAGAVSGKGLIALSEPTAGSATESVAGATQSAKSANAVRRSASGVRRSASESAKSATESVAGATHYPRKCDYCDAQVRSPQAVGAHMKKHHPELCKPKGIKIDASLLMPRKGE